MAADEGGRGAGAMRAARVDAHRRLAARVVGEAWQDGHVAALCDAGLTRLDRKGRPAPDGKPEATGPRADRFYALRYDLSVALAAGAITAGEARARVSASAFAADLRVAGTAAEAVEHLAELFADGNNAWTEAEHAGRVLWVTVWRN